MNSTNDSFYLKIDPNLENVYQIVHVDTKWRYGIIAKFKFSKSNPNTFTVTHIKSISVDMTGKMSQYKVQINTECRNVSEIIPPIEPPINHGYQIDITLTNEEGKEENDDFRVDCLNNECRRKFASNSVEKENIVDLHILNKPKAMKFSSYDSIQKVKDALIQTRQFSNEELNIAVDFGTEFCKFYVL